MFESGKRRDRFVLFGAGVFALACFGVAAWRIGWMGNGAASQVQSPSSDTRIPLLDLPLHRPDGLAEVRKEVESGNFSRTNEAISALAQYRSPEVASGLQLPSATARMEQALLGARASAVDKTWLPWLKQQEMTGEIRSLWASVAPPPLEGPGGSFVGPELAWMPAEQNVKALQEAIDRVRKTDAPAWPYLQFADPSADPYLLQLARGEDPVAGEALQEALKREQPGALLLAERRISTGKPDRDGRLAAAILDLPGVSDLAFAWASVAAGRWTDITKEAASDRERLRGLKGSPARAALRKAYDAGDNRRKLDLAGVLGLMGDAEAARWLLRQTGDRSALDRLAQWIHLGLPKAELVQAFQDFAKLELRGQTDGKAAKMRTLLAGMAVEPGDAWQAEADTLAQELAANPASPGYFDACRYLWRHGSSRGQQIVVNSLMAGELAAYAAVNTAETQADPDFGAFLLPWMKERRPFFALAAYKNWFLAHRTKESEEVVAIYAAPPSPLLREVAAEIYGAWRMGGKAAEALRLLTESGRLDDAQVACRIAAKHRIREFRPQAEALLKDKRPLVRHAAEKALAALGPAWAPGMPIVWPEGS